MSAPAHAQSLAAPQIVTLPLRRFFANAHDIEIEVDDSKVFVPDPAWSHAFAAGLQAVNFGGKRVAEVGVGSGVNMAGLVLCDRPVASFLGVDIANEAVAASQCLADKHGMNVVLRQSDLIKAVTNKELAGLEEIIGCIPQVPVHPGDIHTAREFSDYYEETGIKEDAYGLGLIAQLLDQVKERAPHAAVTLNIGGRPSMDRIAALYADRGFNYRIVHEEMVRQEPTTSLASLAELEFRGAPDFHLFSDQSGRKEKEINASAAEKLRLAGGPVFHKIYVMRASLG